MSSDRPTGYWFDGVGYTGEDRAALVDHLLADPALINVYTDKMLEVIRGQFGWGAFAQAKDDFAVLCDVLADIDERQGNPVMR